MTAYTATPGSPVNGITLSAGDTLTVMSGGTTDNIQVTNGGTEIVLTGGTASATIVRAGGVERVDGGTALSTTASAEGQLQLENGGVGSGTVLVQGGVDDVFFGGSAIDTTIDSKSVEIAWSGGTVSSALVNASGSLIDVPGGTVISPTIAAGGAEITSGVAVLVATGGVFVASPGITVANLDVVSGTPAFVLSGGIVSSAGVETGAELDVYSGGLGSAITVFASGAMAIHSGGSVTSSLVVGGGLEEVFSGGSVVSGSATSGGQLLFNGGSGNLLLVSGSGSEILVESGAVVSQVTDQTSGTVVVQSGGQAVLTEVFTSANLVLSSGGSALVAYVNSGAFAYVLTSGGLSSFYVSSGGNVIVSGGETDLATVARGGEETIYSGGQAINSQIFGDLNVSSGGTVEQALAIGASGNIFVFSGAAASSLEVTSGGYAAVYGGGQLDGLTLIGVPLVAATISGDGTLIALAGASISGGIEFAGPGGEYVTTNSTALTTISAFAMGDLLVAAALPFLSAGSATLDSSDTLVITQGGSSFTAQFDASLTGDTLAWTADPFAGTDIEEVPTVISLTAPETVNNLQIGATQILNVNSGTAADSTVVSNGGIVNIFNTGSTYFTLIYNGGTQYIFSGGQAGATDAFGGLEVVSSAGVATGSVIYAGATQTVLSGGTATGTILGQFGTPGGVEQVANGGTLIGAVLGAGGSLVVSSGAVVTGTTVKPGGSEVIVSGATDSGTTVSAGSVTISSGGTMVDPTVAAGLMFVSNGATVVSPDTTGGGYIAVLPGGVVSGPVASGANVISTGVILLQNGNVAQYGPELDGLSIPFQGSPEYVLSGGVTDGSRVFNGGAEYVLGGVADTTSVSSSGVQIVENGGTAVHTILDFQGQETVAAGGVQSGGVDFAGANALLVVDNPATAGTTLSGFNDSDTLDAAGLPFVASGSGTLTSGFVLTVNEGGQVFTAQFDASIANGTFGWGPDGSGGTDIRVLFDTIFVSGAGNTSSGVVLSAGASIEVYSGGETSNTVLNAGAIEYVSAGGTAIATNLGFGGIQYLSSGGTVTETVFNQGTLVVASGGVDSGTTVYNGSEIVSSGGTATGDTLVNGGGLTVLSGATASNTFVNFQGAMVLSGGGIAVGGTVIYGGNLYVDSSASAVSVTLESGDNFTVSSGGVAIGTFLTDGAGIAIGNGAIISGTVVNSGANETLRNGATDTGTIVEAFGNEIVSGGGAAYFTVIGSAGWETISSGGVASNATVESGGVLVISSGGVAYSPNVAAGGAVIVLAGGAVSGTASGAGLVLSSGVAVTDADFGLVSHGASFAGLAVHSGQTEYVLSGGTTTGTNVSPGGSELVNDGVVTGTTLLSKTTQGASVGAAEETVFSGGVAIGTTEQSGTVMNVQSGATISNVTIEGTGSLSLGGTALNVTISSGASGEIFGGGIASNTVLDNGGGLTVFGGGTASENIVNSGGFLEVWQGGIVSNTTINGAGILDLVQGANSQGNLGGTASGTVTFTGSGGVLALISAPGMNATVVGFVPGDTISLAGAIGATVTLEPGNVLSATGNGQNFAIQLDPTQNFSRDTFNVTSGPQFTIFSNAAEITVSVPGFVPPVLASGTVAPISEYVHAGAPATVALTVSNIAAPGASTENLLGAIAGVTGNITIAAAGPTGEIAAGSSDTSSLRLGFVTASAGIISGTATVDLTSDGGTGGGSIDGDGTTALAPQSVPVSITVENFANPVLEDVSNTGTFTGSGTAYALNLGTLAQGTGPDTVNLGVLNSTTGPSDVVTGSLSAIGSSAFTNSGIASIGTLGAGQSYIAPEITLATGTTGTFSETITLTPAGSNPGGFSTILPAETLTVSGIVVAPLIAPAIADIVNGGSIDFGAVHAGTTANEALDIRNTAASGAAALDASVQSVTGGASASGSFNGLAPGVDNTTSITAGINTGTAGVQTGTVTLGFIADGGSLGSVGLPAQSVTVSGTVYREASVALSPLNDIVHVGDPGTVALPISNSDAADNYSENLVAMLIGATGGLGVASNAPTPEIAAGETNSNALALSFSTAQAGTVSGSVTVGLISDGGIGEGSIDGLGQTTLAAQTIGVNVTIDNYARLALSSDGHLIAAGANAYVLNLGTATQGGAALSADLDLGNNTTGAVDWLNGTFIASGSGQFNNSGLGSVNQIEAGSTMNAGNVVLLTGQAGLFTETITLTPTDANASGFADPLAQQIITVMGTVVAPTGTAQGDVHMVTFDGLHYDFQAIGAYVLTRSTVPDDTFQIQIVTAADPAIAAISITTEVAAQIGSDVVTFGVGRDSTVWVDGAPDTALNAGDPVQYLDGGQLTALSSTVFRLSWATGESLIVTNGGPNLDTSVSLPATDGAGSVQGLLGSDSGQANDFQLPDGTVLRQPLSGAALYGTFAQAWQSASLFGTAPMQFLYGTGSQTVMQATAAGQVLDAGAGAGVLSDTGGYGVTFLGSLAELASETITGFSAKDVIDVTGVNNVTAGYANGVLRLSDGVRTGDIQLPGQISGTSVHVTPDSHGGSLITIS